MKRLLFLSLFIQAIFGSSIQAQTDIGMSTHWYNRSNYNPASIARTDYIYLFSNTRQQWFGIDGAPTVYNAQASGYIHNLRSAFGVSFISDNIGLTHAVNPMLTYAYRIDIAEKKGFSMGLSVGVFSRNIESGKFIAQSVNDPAVYSNVDPINRPDANFGIEYQSAYFIAGISSTHLFALSAPDTVFLNTNHRYSYLKYTNSNSEYFTYNIGMQIANHSNITVLEGNSSVRFKRPTGSLSGPREMFELGFSYRSTKQLTFLFGLNLTSELKVGYAYDHNMNIGYNNPSHEIMLEYRIPSRASSICKCEYANSWYY